VEQTDDVDDSDDSASSQRPSIIRQQLALLSSLPASTLILTLYYNPYERCIYTTLLNSSQADATRVSR
jgi:hypothetical protein